MITFKEFLNERLKYSGKATDKEILSYYDELVNISNKNWKDHRIKIGPEQDTVSKFSHSGNDTKYIKNLIRNNR